MVDPDVDRLAFMDENGDMFGEEYTLVACADYVLSQTPGNTVSNMSSTRALSDVTANHNGQYEASAVGEVNVVELMKKIMLLLVERVMEVLSIQNYITVETLWLVWPCF